MLGQTCIFASSAHFYNFPNIEGGGRGIFLKIFLPGLSEKVLHSNNVCMYFWDKKIALVELWKLNNIYNEAIMIFTITNYLLPRSQKSISDLFDAAKQMGTATSTIEKSPNEQNGDLGKNL